MTKTNKLMIPAWVSHVTAPMDYVDTYVLDTKNQSKIMKQARAEEDSSGLIVAGMTLTGNYSSLVSYSVSALKAASTALATFADFFNVSTTIKVFSSLHNSPIVQTVGGAFSFGISGISIIKESINIGIQSRFNRIFHKYAWKKGENSEIEKAIKALEKVKTFHLQASTPNFLYQKITNAEMKHHSVYFKNLAKEIHQNNPQAIKEAKALLKDLEKYNIRKIIVSCLKLLGSILTFVGSGIVLFLAPHIAVPLLVSILFYTSLSITISTFIMNRYWVEKESKPVKEPLEIAKQPLLYVDSPISNETFYQKLKVLNATPKIHNKSHHTEEMEDSWFESPAFHIKKYGLSGMNPVTVRHPGKRILEGRVIDITKYINHKPYIDSNLSADEMKKHLKVLP